MTGKQFTLAYEKGNWWAVKDGDITLWKEEVIYLLNEQHETIMTQKTQIDFLQDENKDFRNKIDKNKNTLNEMINNERTYIGQSVLKQYKEEIQNE